MSSLWEQRAARNEALFREVNESIARLEEEYGSTPAEPAFICECGHDLCHEQIFLTLDAFIAIRDRGDVVLAEGHRLSQVDRARRLREDAEGLRAQAKHQVARTKKNIG